MVRTTRHIRMPPARKHTPQRLQCAPNKQLTLDAIEAAGGDEAAAVPPPLTVETLARVGPPAERRSGVLHWSIRQACGGKRAREGDETEFEEEEVYEDVSDGEESYSESYGEEEESEEEASSEEADSCDNEETG